MASFGSNDSLHLPGHALIQKQEVFWDDTPYTFLQTFLMSSLPTDAQVINKFGKKILQSFKWAQAEICSLIRLEATANWRQN